jgi:hypothetical protein
MSLARLEALAEAAIAALEAGDYVTAIQRAISIKPLLAVTPELTRGSSGDSQAMAFRSGDAIDAFVRECRQAANRAAAESSGPFAQSLVRYQRSGE